MFMNVPKLHVWLPTVLRAAVVCIENDNNCDYFIKLLSRFIYFSGG
jgi:hypothetical protein